MATKSVDPTGDKRSADQDAAIEQAFVAGTLPEEDRRAPFDLARAIKEQGLTLESRNDLWQVWTKDGRHGEGPTPEDAIRNIGAQIIPVQREDYVGRLLVRADGSEVKLDVVGHREG